MGSVNSEHELGKNWNGTYGRKLERINEETGKRALEGTGNGIRRNRERKFCKKLGWGSWKLIGN